MNKKDLEKPEYLNYNPTAVSSSEDSEKPISIWRSMVDSFKPALPKNNIDDPTDTNLRRTLKNRHQQMIALGSSIGSGLFVGTGSALSTGGAASIVISWIVAGLAVFLTMQGAGEMSVSFPVSGSFNLYASQFIEPAVGFAIGWNYFLQFWVLLPLEIVAGSMIISFWNKDINPDVWVVILWVAISFITILPNYVYGEAELYFCLIKIIAVVGFIILGIVLIAGGGPTHDYIGGRYWRNPGPFNNGFHGFCSVLVTASFSYGGTEMIALTSAESANVRKSLPKAIKQVFWRIVLFYMGSIVMIATLVPSNDPRLLNGSSSVDVTASPFVIAVVNGGISGLPSVINAVVLISVLSVGNASVYACSRTLNSLSEQGMAPSQKWLYVDRAGRPIMAILSTLAFGLFAFIATDQEKQVAAFNWLLALSGLSSIFTWLSINVSHIRFRCAMSAQNRSIDELPFVAQTGVIGSYIGATLNILFLIAQLYVSIFPVGDSPSAENFFLGYLGFVTLILSWLFYKLWKREWRLFIRAKDIDVDRGRINIDIDILQQEMAEEKARLAEKPFYVRLYSYWC